MPNRTVDLSGTYVIESLSATEMALAGPEQVNPNWLYADLDGAGTTGYAQNISMVSAPAYTSVDLSGIYTVVAVTPTTIELDNPIDENTDWGWLALFPDLQTQLLSASVSKSGGNWIGPFIVEAEDTALLVANFVAGGGLFKDNGKKQKPFPITMELEATRVDSSDAPIGAPETFSVTIEGNSKGRDQRAATLVCELANPGRQSVRARRTTNADLNYKGTVVDEVKWQDLYGVAGVPFPDFGNVTTVHSRTYATEGALAVKDRKLNMLATRLVPIRTVGTSFDPPAPTRDAANIFTALCLDPYLGGRALAELDLDAIYGTVAAAIAYFGDEAAGCFDYTFDDDNISFEESAALIANAVFCTSFRQGSLIRLALESATEDSVLLFNHRNKLPGTERRTIRFGNFEDDDGVELEWTDPKDGAKRTFYLPADRSATHPRQIKATGVRSYEQAFWAAWRAWAKIQHQNAAIEFTALQEAALVSRNDRVLITDNTRPDTQDGEVLGAVALQLETSQPVAFAAGGYTMFIQLPDGTVDSMPVVAGADAHHVIIGRAPRVALIFGRDQYALPTYQIVRNDSPRPSAFLIGERQGQDNFTHTIRAINYSPLYYLADTLVMWLDFNDGYLDAGPFLRDGAAVGASAITNDGTRGPVHLGAAAGDRLNLPAFNAPASYTKAFWVKRTSQTGAGSILGSTSTHERVKFSGAHKTPPLLDISTVTIEHGGASVCAAAWTQGVGWAHVAATYDADGGGMALYVNGELIASAAGVAQRTLGNLHAVGYNGGDGMPGRVDDLRLFRRALAPAEVRALYRATRL
jgi:hypothetical protein